MLNEVVGMAFMQGHEYVVDEIQSLFDGVGLVSTANSDRKREVTLANGAGEPGAARIDALVLGNGARGSRGDDGLHLRSDLFRGLWQQRGEGQKTVPIDRRVHRPARQPQELIADPAAGFWCGAKSAKHAAVGVVRECRGDCAWQNGTAQW